MYEPENLEKLRKLAIAIEPTALIFATESSRLMAFLNFFAHFFNPTFLTTAAVTVGNRIYMPSSWFSQNVSAIVVHECQHIKQYRWCGLGIHPMVGFPIFWFLYGFVFFPIFLAVFRYLFELQAYAKAWQWKLIEGERAVDVREEAAENAEVVAGWKYLRPLPRGIVTRGFSKRYERVLAGFGVAHA